MGEELAIPASLTLSAGARGLLCARFSAANDAELLHALRAFGVRELHHSGEAWARHAVLEAVELLRRLERGADMPQIVCACPAWALQLRRERPEWAALLSPRPRLPGGQGEGEAAISGCAALKDWLTAELGVTAYTACELMTALLNRGARLRLDAAAAPRPDPNGSRLYEVLHDAARLCGDEPSERIRLAALTENPFIREGTARINGRRLVVASVCGAGNAMRYLEQVKSDRRACHVLEVRSCASCRA